MKKETETKKTPVKKVVKKTLKKGFKKYPLKKPTKIGDIQRPIGFEIELDKDGYKFYKQKNIV